MKAVFKHLKLLHLPKSTNKKTMRKKEVLKDYIVQLCKICEKNIKTNEDKNIQLIESIGEVSVNGTEYQMQVILEPSKEDWIEGNKTTVRIFED